MGEGASGRTSVDESIMKEGERRFPKRIYWTLNECVLLALPTMIAPKAGGREAAVFRVLYVHFEQKDAPHLTPRSENNDHHFSSRSGSVSAASATTTEKVALFSLLFACTLLHLIDWLVVDSETSVLSFTKRAPVNKTALRSFGIWPQVSRRYYPGCWEPAHLFNKYDGSKSSCFY